MKSVIVACVLMAALLVPDAAGAQPRQPATSHKDRLWNGMLIGAAIGAAAGMLVAPPAFCGRNDSECAAIVRVAIGLPAIGAGIGVGALVDGLHKSQAPGSRPFAGAKSAQITFRF